MNPVRLTIPTLIWTLNIQINIYENIRSVVINEKIRVTNCVRIIRYLVFVICDTIDFDNT